MRQQRLINRGIRQMFSFLSKVPFIGTITGFFVGKARLIIEYVLIGMVIAIAATAFTLWVRANKLEIRNDELRGRVTTTELINQAQDETITELQALRTQDSLVITGLLTDYTRLNESDTKARKKLAQLEKENATVREYLDRPLPPELSCMLNNSCGAASTDASGKGSPTAPASGSVQKARPSSAVN